MLLKQRRKSQFERDTDAKSVDIQKQFMRLLPWAIGIALIAYFLRTPLINLFRATCGC